MELYTIISLIIGIFGATYASLNALRNYYEPRITESHSNSKEALIRLKKVLVDGHSIIGSCQNHSETINKWQTTWRWCHSLPTIGFALFIFFIAGWTLLSWNDVTAQHLTPDLVAKKEEFPWSWMRGGLFCYISGNFIAFVVAIIAYSKCIGAAKIVQEHDEGQKAENRFSPPVNGESSR